MKVRSLFLRVALCGAIAAWTTPSAADDLVPALSVQTGATYTRSPGNDLDDYFVAATPSLTYFIDTERTMFSLTYAFTGSLDSELPNGIANQLTFASATDLGPRTQLLFSVTALQSLVGNYLLVRRSADTQIGQLPPLNTSLLTIGASQGIVHELSPVLRMSQGVSGTYVTSLDPDVELQNYLAQADFGLTRQWQFDSVGGDISFQYANTYFPPLDATTMTVATGPSWDHDLSRTLTMSLAAGVQVAFSPDPGTKAQVGPAGRAALLFTPERGYGVQASYDYGVAPNVLLGTLLRSHLAQIRGFAPISEKNNIVFGVSAGYLRAETIDLQTNGALDTSFDAVLHDADVSWGATDYLNLFVRYQFIGQSSASGPAGGAALVRHAAILGVDLFGARRAVRQRTRVPTRFPQRVDGADRLGGSDTRASQQQAPSR